MPSFAGAWPMAAVLGCDASAHAEELLERLPVPLCISCVHVLAAGRAWQEGMLGACHA